MAPETVPEDLRRFILTSIPSVPFLEALLLLKAEARGWSLDEIARRLYMPEAATRETLRGLCDAGMAAAVAPDSYRLMPSTDELRSLIDRLADAYAHDLIAITTLIHSRMGKSAQVFADAFKIRKDS